jgi:hypothetical protein
VRIRWRQPRRCFAHDSVCSDHFDLLQVIEWHKNEREAGDWLAALDDFRNWLIREAA